MTFTHRVASRSMKANLATGIHTQRLLLCPNRNFPRLASSRILDNLHLSSGLQVGSQHTSGSGDLAGLPRLPADVLQNTSPVLSWTET